MKDRRCQARTKAGQPCPAPARYRRRFCYQHDPDPKAAQHRALARLQGGLNATHQQLLPVKQRRFKEVEDLDALADETICLVAARAIKPAVANSIVNLIAIKLQIAGRAASAELLAKLRGQTAAKRIAGGTSEAPIDVVWGGVRQAPVDRSHPRERQRSEMATP